MSIERKMVNRTKTLYDEFEGKLKTIRERIDKLIEEVGEEAELYIDYGYDGYNNYELRYQRLETEKEAEKRIKAAAKTRERNKAQKLKKEEAERKELARLLKKYVD